MKIKLISIIGLVLISGSVSSQTPPEPAEKVMKDAFNLASKENKNVMIIFHASWCGWCKRLEASINDPSCSDYFNKNFVIRYLTILESASKKDQENPGAIDLFNENGGKGGGIPYFLIYNKSGKLLSDSRAKIGGPGPDVKLTNLGCPATDDEVAAFIDILKNTTGINEQEIAAITERFKKNSH
jgi:thiol-disulfide isomerase/thioredoxin